MPTITIETITGRTQAQRDALAVDVTEAVVKNYGVTPEQVVIRFTERDPDMQYRGGKTFRIIKGL